MPETVTMQPYPPQQSVESDTHSHRGPLSRTWPQLFKKRRRYSPVRESAQQAQQPPQNLSQHQPAPQYAQIQPQAQSQAQFQASVPLRPVKHPSISTAIAGGVPTPTADLLASKSNYELISSGQHLEMGLHFSTAMATGVMMKRATHRAAEQARRDRMKTAMVDLAEFLLDGEVTFGSGTTCFVVMRGEPKEGDGQSVFSETSGVSGMSAVSEGSGKGRPGEKKTVNKARLIEMALEKMKAQELEIELLRKEVEVLRCGDKVDEMDES
ncbi:hypothetical protein N0V91_006813 [Didymella pomorum]|uniref:BHLH domain-containing protein n=1 Tax=Didymella pomorum TaxID=749634 RepID=A0A9W8Z9S6_9PLEO|nr:hypothetical protein N0V91_006813 [Didymella pomorum]